jgi:hypothetical protein
MTFIKVPEEESIIVKFLTIPKDVFWAKNPPDALSN